ncbi:unnamed protein product [Didymodactylos carnosus]|uniref:Uncharacterized protein n=1 Tax=Didymodactylos carnosus TaxID=1234261 RepID=A0A814YXB7_9BILA|nr:unnamed protein product [Didymodactylos carnosus]CAF3998353.1 unnamed protein product [Didymodactylos carnosus]
MGRRTSRKVPPVASEQLSPSYRNPISDSTIRSMNTRKSHHQKTGISTLAIIKENSAKQSQQNHRQDMFHKINNSRRLSNTKRVV